MAITHTNRKGVTYFLCQGTTKTGKQRFYFARDQKGEPQDAIPSGYELVESINGIVSLAKARPNLITPDEVASVNAALEKHPKGGKYRVSVKHNRIILYEMVGPDVGDMMSTLGKISPLPTPALQRVLQESQDRFSQFTPIVRFTLTDPQKREFIAERWCFRGSIDDWIWVGYSSQLEKLTMKIIPTLGTNDFYDLC